MSPASPSRSAAEPDSLAGSDAPLARPPAPPPRTPAGPPRTAAGATPALPPRTPPAASRANGVPGAPAPSPAPRAAAAPAQSTVTPRVAAPGTPPMPATERAPVAAPEVEAPRPSPARKSAAASDDEQGWFSASRLGLLTAALVIWFGYEFPTERYLSPENGIGYALGIIGGSAMLLLLLYPARKRFRWIGFLGTVKGWFQAHMVLGVVGPLLILYHSNFSLGATNSNAALWSMLLVSGSGIFGRYFYTRIHLGLYGRRASRTDMQSAADELREKVAGSKFVPDLLEMLDAADQKLLARSGPTAMLLVRPLFVSLRMYQERWRITRRATRELRDAAKKSPVLKAQHQVFAKAVKRYIARRLEATRRVAEFESFERLFSLWHVLHLPLFFLLLIAGIVHVIAVHVY